MLNVFWFSICLKGGSTLSIFSDRFEQLKKADKPVKAPKYLQQTMGFTRISRDGIFEVAKGRYSVFWILIMLQQVRKTRFVSCSSIARR